jgi:hypothetical protein
VKIQIDIETQVRQWFESKSPEDQVEFLRGILQKSPPLFRKPKKEEVEKKTVKKTSFDLKPVKTTPDVTKVRSGRGITKKCTVLGQQFPSLKQAAEHYDIPYHKVAYRWATTEGNVEKTFHEAYEKAKANHNPGVVIRR